MPPCCTSPRSLPPLARARGIWWCRAAVSCCRVAASSRCTATLLLPHTADGRLTYESRRSRRMSSWKRHGSSPSSRCDWRVLCTCWCHVRGVRGVRGDAGDAVAGAAGAGAAVGNPIAERPRRVSAWRDAAWHGRQRARHAPPPRKPSHRRTLGEPTLRIDALPAWPCRAHGGLPQHHCNACTRACLCRGLH